MIVFSLLVLGNVAALLAVLSGGGHPARAELRALITGRTTWPLATVAGFLAMGLELPWAWSVAQPWAGVFAGSAFRLMNDVTGNQPAVVGWIAAWLAVGQVAALLVQARRLTAALFSLAGLGWFAFAAMIADSPGPGQAQAVAIYGGYCFGCCWVAGGRLAWRKGGPHIGTP